MTFIKNPLLIKSNTYFPNKNLILIKNIEAPLPGWEIGIPLNIISKISLDYLKHLIEIKDGRSSLTVNSILLKCNKFDITKYTFSNIKKMTKKYELTFLNKEYFNRLSTKLLLIK